VTTRFERIEVPELPKGADIFERWVIVFIAIVGFLGAGAVFLETQASNREATADRNAKVEMLEVAHLSVEQSSRLNISDLSTDAHEEWATLDQELDAAGEGDAEAGGYFLALARASSAVATAIDREKYLTAEGPTRKLDKEFYRHEQAAKAYEEQRDEYTSKAKRFITVITDFAVALFLLGLVAAVPLGVRRRRWWLLTLPGLIAVAAVVWSVYIGKGAPEGPNTSAIERYAEGRVAADRGYFEEATQHYAGAIELEEGYFDAHLNRGEAYFQLGRLEDATKDFEEATRVDPQSHEAWNLLAVSFWWRRDYAEALGAIEQAAKLNPNDPTVAFNRAEGLLVASGETSAYAKQVRHFAQILKSLVGLGASDHVRFDIEDVARSASQDPRIKPQMQVLCHDLVGVASSAGYEISGYDCHDLPSPTRLRIRYVGGQR
jgi:tetratricopeptide (TPR) repeat protein